LKCQLNFLSKNKKIFEKIMIFKEFFGKINYFSKKFLDKKNQNQESPENFLELGGVGT